MDCAQAALKAVRHALGQQQQLPLSFLVAYTSAPRELTEPMLEAIAADSAVASEATPIPLVCLRLIPCVSTHMYY